MKIAFYKGVHDGPPGLFNRFVKWWTTGPYSHTEAVFEGTKGIGYPVLCWSSSFMDGGVRWKEISLDPAKWDVIEVPAFDPVKSMQWFQDHKGEDYDLIGLLSTSLPVPHNPHKWICNEAVGESGGLVDAWRFNPNSFARFVERLPGSYWVQGSMSTSSNK